MRRVPVSRFQGYLLLSAALIGAVVVASGFIVGDFFERRVLAEEETRTAETVQNQARQHLSPPAFATTPSATTAREFEHFLEGLPRVFRIKAFDPEGTIVWSNEPRLIGMRFSDNAYLNRALQGGVTTVLESPTRTEHVFEQGRAWVAEAYIPISFPDSPRVAGVVETYKDMTEVVQGIRGAQRRIWMVAGTAGLLLYLSLALVVWKSSASERRAIARLSDQNRDLRSLQAFTRSVLGPLDPAEVETSLVRSAVQGLGFASAALWRVEPDGPPTRLAAWPPDAPPEPFPQAGEEPETPQAAERDGLVTEQLRSAHGVARVFVGRLASPAGGGPAGASQTLGLMLDQAAIALAHAEAVLQIREAHERIAAILAGIADQMMIVDREMRVVWMNAAAAAVAERTAGVRCFEAMRVSPEVCEHCPAVRAFVSGAVERGVRQQRRASGETRYLDLVAAPLRDSGGEVQQVLEVARDITELIEMETRVKETNQALLEAQTRLVERERLAAVGEVVVGLHHAILNPLTGVLGALRVLGGDDVAAADRARAIAEAEAEVRKIEQLVRRLPELRSTGGTTYVGKTTMLDLERVLGQETTLWPKEGPAR